MLRYKYLNKVFILLFLGSELIFAQPARVNFEHLTTNDGLSFNSIFSIYQDSRGFLWFGTRDGLDRYDGITFRNYKTEEKKYLQIVTTLTEDRLGSVWTGNPLLRYDPVTDKQYANRIAIDETVYMAGGMNGIKIGPDAFSSRAEALSLDYSILIPEKQIMLWIDREKMEKTLINLFLNAFKFCRQGGVRIEVMEEADRVMLKVEDTGIDIPADQIVKIFDNYYQVGNTYTKDRPRPGKYFQYQGLS